MSHTKNNSSVTVAYVSCGRMIIMWVIFVTFFDIPVPSWPQNLVGIKERVANTSLKINLDAEPPPETISSSGLFSNLITQTPSPGIIPYSVNSPLWADGAHKVRYLALPDRSQIKFSRDGIWKFPANTILVKSFYLDMVRDDPSTRRIIETRLLIKRGESNFWKGFSYQWNEEGTDAELLATGRTKRYKKFSSQSSKTFSNIDYIFPAPEDCSGCHTPGSGIVLGLRTSQLNGSHDYGESMAHQLHTLNSLGIFSEDIGEEFDNFPRWENPADTTATIASRARAYLAANCAHCHRPGGLRRTDIDLRYNTNLSETGLIDMHSHLDDLDGLNRRIVSPGSAQNSILTLRMIALDDRRMPPIATAIVDTEAVNLVSRWIDALSPTTVVADVSTATDTSMLLNSFPNPFNSTTTIIYVIPETKRAHLAVHDITGQRIRSLISAEHKAGTHKILWDGLDQRGNQVGSGMFLIYLQTKTESRSMKLTLVR